MYIVRKERCWFDYVTGLSLSAGTFQGVEDTYLLKVGTEVGMTFNAEVDI